MGRGILVFSVCLSVSLPPTLTHHLCLYALLASLSICIYHSVSVCRSVSIWDNDYVQQTDFQPKKKKKKKKKKISRNVDDSFTRKSSLAISDCCYDLFRQVLCQQNKCYVTTHAYMPVFCQQCSVS